ncbi:MAG: septum formation initiator family protein [Gemmatimonadetes bacterium]|jgi:cell division protein FtsB|nr:septum formation initiator family protein [Gemmatimonadota bacterium]MBP9105565.1 septum formation initiator family protein [Gemmatimonadaceae bacterium]MBK6456817.1 septum formation initiator family protein [Gemmatimonadota bacterium]MBK6842340.1 septum formation initiator family protein [Gemmatimonadota bacterium]MBK7836046.1 septum formation initiator family protein [Gemmatimonadota bacterium]
MKRFAVALGLVLVVYFAVQGGEYSTTDLFRQRSRDAVLRRTIDSLQHDVDSLTRLKRRLATDPVLQERIAREENGMVRSDKELIYRFTEAEKPAKGTK